MASPFSLWLPTRPTDTESVSIYPAFARNIWAVLGAAGAGGGVLGTLAPTTGGGTPTTGWRVNQDFDTAYLTQNAWYSGTAWTFDNTAKPAWMQQMGPVNDYLSWQRAPASANPPVFSELMRLTSTGVLQGLSNVAVGTTPAGTGTVRVPSAGTVSYRNLANNADITGWSFGDGTTDKIYTAASEIYPFVDAATQLGEGPRRFTNLYLSGDVLNASGGPKYTSTSVNISSTGMPAGKSLIIQAGQVTINGNTAATTVTLPIAYTSTATYQALASSAQTSAGTTELAIAQASISTASAILVRFVGTTDASLILTWMTVGW